MSKKPFLLAALAVLASAAIFFATAGRPTARARPGFVARDGARFVVDGRPFRFVGANVAVIYGDEDQARMSETLHRAALDRVRVVRVWAFGERGDDDETPAGVTRGDWLRPHPFRRGPEDWNEAAFVNLDRVLAAAARENLRVQICLTNWWRDTGGVVRYLRWAGIDAADESQPFGINVERAILFYTNETARRLYREHVARIVARRNTVTGQLYRDDPTIMGYELMNEAQTLAGRSAERRAWVAEMSAYIKSLDPDHLVAPGTWGPRFSWERREWLAEHSLPTIDYCDVHIYPRDDLDSYVDSPQALDDFIANRAAAAFSIDKPLVIGEFGMTPEGYRNFSRDEWYRAYFEATARAGVGGAMFWILTPDTGRGYGVSSNTPRDESVHAEILRGADLFASLQEAAPPSGLLDAGHHLVPHQFAFARQAADPCAQPSLAAQPDGTLVYRFAPESASSARFEKLGFGKGYIWGMGVGQIEYLVPARDGWRKAGRLVVRAHLQPELPRGAQPPVNSTRVTLFINDRDCGSRLVQREDTQHQATQEWLIDSYLLRLQAARGRQLEIRFAVKVDADQPFGLNISNYAEGQAAPETMPVEVEVG